MLSKIQDCLNIPERTAQLVMPIIRINPNVTWETYSDTQMGLTWQDETAPSMDGFPETKLQEILGCRKVALLFDLLMTLRSQGQGHKSLYPGVRTWHEGSRGNTRSSLSCKCKDVFQAFLTDDIEESLEEAFPYRQHAQYIDPSMSYFISQSLHISMESMPLIMYTINVPEHMLWHDFRFEKLGEHWQQQQGVCKDKILMSLIPLAREKIISVEQMISLSDLLIRDQPHARYPRFMHIGNSSGRSGK
jgi:hypothetical protein